MPCCLIKAPTPWLRCNPCVHTSTSDWPLYSPPHCAYASGVCRREPGINLGSDANSSSVRTSMIAGECGSPIKRESCGTVISVVDGTCVLLRGGEEKDAIFGLPPHEVIAKNPLCRMHTMKAAVSRGSPGTLSQARAVRFSQSLEDEAIARCLYCGRWRWGFRLLRKPRTAWRLRGAPAPRTNRYLRGGDRFSPIRPTHLVCRLLLEKKKALSKILSE